MKATLFINTLIHQMILGAMSFITIFAPRMDHKIRIGAVSYLNTLPLIYGLENSDIQHKITLVKEYPSQLTSLLQKDMIDIALLPIASIQNIQNARIISDYCIGSYDKVASVCLFSEVPIEEIQEIYLDYQSRTSVMLLRILLKEYWHIRPSLLDADEHYIKNISGKTAGLIIGDRALENSQRFPFVYDLANAWHDYTKKPFVFATWVANKEISADFLKEFNEANAMGLQKLNEIANSISYPHYDLNTYYTQNISYTLDEEKRNGMTMFLKMDV